MLHLTEFFNLVLDITCRPRSRMKEWKDTNLDLKNRIDSIAQQKQVWCYVHFIIGLILVSSHGYYWGIFDLIGILFYAFAIVNFLTSLMLIYGNNFNCPRLLLPFVVLNLYFSFIVLSRYKEMLFGNTESADNKKEKEANEIQKNNEIASIDEYRDFDLGDCKSVSIFLDNPNDISTESSISIPEVHKPFLPTNDISNSEKS